MSLPSAAASFDGGATYGGGGSPPFSLVYFLVRLSLLLLLWLLQSSRHDEIRKLLLKRRRRRRRRSCCCFYGPIRESCVRWSRDLDISAVLILFPQSIYIFYVCWKSNIALVEKPIWYITGARRDSSGKREMMFHIWWKTPATRATSSTALLLKRRSCFFGISHH